MKKIILFLLLAAGIGCAKVQVQAPKDPIKVDISMRLDIYQHIEKDIDAIESIVGSKNDQSSRESYFVKNVYAEEALSPEVEQAAYRRRDRADKINALKSQGILGENRSGLLEVKSNMDSMSIGMVEEENSDRMVIYRSLAGKNNTSLEEIQKIYAGRLQGGSPSGTPIEALSEASSGYEWKIK